MAQEQTPKITVSPTILTLTEKQKQTLTISVEGEYTVSPSEFLTFDKAKKELTAVKASGTPVTLNFTKDDETVTIQVTINPYKQENGLIVQKKTFENRTNITEGYFGDVRLIEDGKDYVAAQFTNRPHKDTLENISVLSSVEDIRGLHSTGAWDISEIYQKGSIVSFLSEYFISLQDNNTGNIPKLSSQKDTDLYWKPVCNITDVCVSEFSPKGREGLTTSQYYPFSNGKNSAKVKLKGGRTYTLYRLSKLLPFRDSFSMYVDFTDSLEKGAEDSETRSSNPADKNSPDFPYVSYIECDVLYTGLKNNLHDLFLPELRFGTCHTSILGRDVQLRYPANDQLHGFDKYGPYGVSMQSCIRNDEMVSITITPKWDCEILFSGDYRTTPLALDELGSIGATPYFTVNHLVRPFGGDLARELGSIVSYEKALTSKQIWDRGLINRCAARTLYSTEYTLLALALGYLVNTGDTKPSSLPSNASGAYNNKGQEIKMDLPKLGEPTANPVFTKAF